MDINKIALIIPHFGNFKNYVSFWLESCKNNPNVDFLIFTDYQSILEKVKGASNLYGFSVSLDDLKNLIEQKLCEKVCLKHLINCVITDLCMD